MKNIYFLIFLCMQLEFLQSEVIPEREEPRLQYKVHLFCDVFNLFFLYILVSKKNK